MIEIIEGMEGENDLEGCEEPKRIERNRIDRKVRIRRKINA